mmetsp:Transcript_26551/g.79203  ORF Transcript_26551/g.79203 Transcript_26551/m.79203 type:complete len:85 (-) Transcript_26551:235-489(-)
MPALLAYMRAAENQGRNDEAPRLPPSRKGLKAVSAKGPYGSRCRRRKESRSHARVGNSGTVESSRSSASPSGKDVGLAPGVTTC